MPFRLVCPCGLIILIVVSLLTANAHQIELNDGHDMEMLSIYVVLYDGKTLATGGFPSEMPILRSFNVFVDVCFSILLN